MEIARLKEELIQQRKSKFKGNIYHYSQVNFAYNSNKIEGGRLSEDETEEIFETDSFIPKSDETIKLDDLIEMKNHFRLFDYTLDTLNDDLSKEMIINMNKILKRNTTDEENPRYNVGGFKIIPNKIGLINVIDTSAPEDVEKDIGNLLLEYKKIKNVTIEDIIDFHYKFELIHPFGDGNGRVGRMIMFRECLRNNIMPFIVLDNDKSFYMRGLKNYKNDKSFYMRGLKNYKNDKLFLIDTIKHEQDLYEDIVNEMLDFYLNGK